MASRSLLLLGSLVLWMSGCPSSHDPAAGDTGGVLDAPTPATDAPAPGTDAPGADVPGLDAPVRADAPASLACDVPSACTLRPRSCCGSCGAATPTDMIALPDDEVAAYVAAVCEDVGCPECAQPTDPYLIATCAAGACVAVDLHESALTECATSADCVLSAAECCACGLLGVEQTIAHSPANGSLGTLICDPDADCPPCVPDFGELTAECVSGRCVVVAPGP